MDTKNEPHWQPKKMIPIFVKLTAEMLESSQKQLTNLECAKGRSHILTDELVKSSLKCYQKQLNNLPIYAQQCKRWQVQRATAEQLRRIKTIEQNISALKKIDEQILFLLTHYQNGTINQILAKEDAELALELLCGKIDLP